jgi:hypothetical protein
MRKGEDGRSLLHMSWANMEYLSEQCYIYPLCAKYLIPAAL